jgi:hypothetical protein
MEQVVLSHGLIFPPLLMKRISHDWVINLANFLYMILLILISLLSMNSFLLFAYQSHNLLYRISLYKIGDFIYNIAQIFVQVASQS